MDVLLASGSSSSMMVSGLVSTTHTGLSKDLLIGRGGAALAATTAFPPIELSGGAATGDVTFMGFTLTPEARSVLLMATAMALHYLGYSLARPTTLALFTSSRTGYGGYASAFPLAMAFVSPTALLLLMGYGRVLDAHGPKGALTRTTIFCATVMSGAAIVISILEESGLKLWSIPVVKFISGPLFVFRESYVQLLTSQYWSFMASTLTPAQSARWFAPISGLTSLTSAGAGLAVTRIVEKVGLTGALLGTGFTLILSLFATGSAYSIAERYGFAPTSEPQSKKDKSKSQAKGKPTVDEEAVGMFEKASKLFSRVPVLKALFLEILSAQGLATLLNVCFVSRLSSSIPNDAERAGWMGKFFALINIISMSLQFGVLPPLMTVIEPRHLWRAVPLIALCFTTFQAIQKDPSLYVVSASLLVMKALEYSARRMLDEMVYVPLDFESRYVGKEVIGVFGYRFGKSSMSLALSALTSVFGNFELQQLSILTNGVSLLWLAAAWKLSNLVPTRKEAEALYEKRKD